MHVIFRIVRPTFLRPQYSRRLFTVPAPMSQLDLSPSPNIQETIDKKEVDDRIFEEHLSLSAEEGGGYYPSAITGHRVGQYEIVRKLGWASSSTVWLSVDTSSPSKTYVAVKILSAHATATIVGGISAEYDVFRRIESSNPHHPGFPHCLTIHDCFTTRSSAGGHICFVTDVLGSDMGTLRSAQPNKTFSVPIAKRIIKQVLLGVDYLHRECGYVHTDIRVDNILAVLPEPIVPLIDKYLEDHKLATHDNLEASPETIKSQPLTDFNTDLRHLMVRLIDYGAASPIEKHLHDEFYQADIVRAPEITLGHPWSTPVDIWSVGCLLFELVTNFHLFCQPGPSYSADLHLQNVVECLGPFPPQFLEACSHRAEYFNEDGSLLRVDDFESSSLEDILYDFDIMHADDVPYVAVFMRRCLALDPASRASALELLNDKWLEDV